MAMFFLLRASGALLAALAVAFVCRRRSAALRHFVLACGVGIALAALPIGGSLPVWELAVPLSVTRAAADVGAVSRAARAEPTETDPVSVVARPGSTTRRPIELAGVLLGLWLAGLAAMTFRLITGLVGLRRITRRASRLEERRWTSQRDALAVSLGLTRRVSLVTADTAVATWGLLRPTIAVPLEAVEWQEERVRAVLAHELAHVRRTDWAVQLAADLLRAVLWFNPLAWVVARRVREEAERACDDSVLASGVPEAAYATHLLVLARTGRAAVQSAATSIARPSTLEGRIAAMLNPTIDRRPPSRVVRVAVVAVLAVLACGAAVRVSAQAVGPLPLQGTVYDSSGGVLPAVEMVLTDDQGVKWTTPTDREGRFEFAPVAAGKFLLEASIPGLRQLHQEIVLERAQDWNRLITMQLGELQETVQVTARRPKNLAPLTAPTGPVRVGGNIKPPRRIVDVRPQYPESMRLAGLEGVVKLDVLIATDGTVASVRVLSSEAHPDFAAAAADAVRQWRFTSTLLNGRAVEVAMTVSIKFSLSD